MSKSKNNFATKALRHQEKKTAEIILAAIIIFSFFIFHSSLTSSPKLIDISAPGSAAFCSAAESFFVPATKAQRHENLNADYAKKLATNEHEFTQTTARRNTPTPACGFSLTQAGNFYPAEAA